MDNTADKLKVNRQLPGQQNRDWDDTVTNLDKLKLSKAEISSRNFSRQSHNQLIAKAELLGKEKLGKVAKNFSPTMSAKLRVDASKTVDEALSDSSNTLALAQKIRIEGVTNNFDRIEKYFLNGSHAPDSTEGKESDGQSQEDILLPEYERAEELSNNSLCAFPRSASLSPSARATVSSYPLSPHGWQNLNNTIQLVVKTCEALWQQLEEERLNRDRLLIQLEEQRSIVTTLTSELLQVQEHQDIILQELQTARELKLFSSVSGSRPPSRSEPAVSGLTVDVDSFPSLHSGKALDGISVSPRRLASSQPPSTTANTDGVGRRSPSRQGLLAHSRHPPSSSQAMRTTSTPTNPPTRSEQPQHSNQLNLQGFSGSRSAQLDSQQGYCGTVNQNNPLQQMKISAPARGYY